MDTQTNEELPEQPHVGGFCETCGHFAIRHALDGCMFPGVDDISGCKTNCTVFVWNGVEWPRPWLAAPDGLKAES